MEIEGRDEARREAKRKQGTRAKLLAFLIAIGLRALFLTWRKEARGLDRLDRMLGAREPIIAAFWHGRIAALFPWLAGRHAVIFTSVSKRGDVIAGACRRFGYACVQIPDHGRTRSLTIMKEALARYPVCGVAVDGPLGPYHAVKRGAVELASELGFKIVPISVAANHKWMARRRWDRNEVPMPFAHVALVVGSALSVPAGLAADGVESWSDRLRRALLAGDRECVEMVGEDPGSEPRSPQSL
ncbi:MAG TPA: DUF374 domain-containing protein [Thermoanaerobaculia bacterium]|nr:DUF374 domain-containing protein [Thermoanaerobaculia bacterium]